MPLTVKMRESGGFDLHEADEWHPGLLVEIREETGGMYGPSLKWIIELDDDEPFENGETRQTWAFCSTTLSPRSKLHGWVRAIDPDMLPEPGETIDLEDLVGRRVQVMFEHYEGDFDGEPVPKEKVVKIRADKAAKAAKQTKKAAPDDDEAPF